MTATEVLELLKQPLEIIYPLSFRLSTQKAFRRCARGVIELPRPQWYSREDFDGA